MAELSPSAAGDSRSLSLAEMSPSSSISWEMEVPSSSQLMRHHDSHNESVAPFAPVVKRRRLSCKQPLPSAWGPPVSCDGDTPADVAGDDEKLKGPNLYAVFYGRVRRWLLRLNRECAQRGEAVAVAFRKPLSKCSPDQRLALVQGWVAGDGTSPEWLKMWALKRYGDKGPSEERWFDGKELLLTWNGMWGGGGLLGLEELGLGWATVDDLCRVLARSDVVNRIIVGLQAKVSEWQHALEVEHIAWSIELSTLRYQRLRARALQEQGLSLTPLSDVGLEECSQAPAAGGAPDDQPGRPVRVHAHCFLRFRARQRLNSGAYFDFLGSRSVKSSLSNQVPGRQRQLGFVGMYYMQCPKIGMIKWGGTLAPFKDYPVNADWITNLLQSQKMLFVEARVELAKIVKGIDRNIIAIEKWKGEASAAALEEHIAMVSDQLEAMKRPFKQIPIVQLWAAHYEVLRWRYKFLVLEGPSCYGKTQFAKGLCLSPNSFL